MTRSASLRRSSLKTAFAALAVCLGVSLAPSLAFAVPFNCIPAEVSETVGSKVTVRCSNSVTISGASIRFISISTQNQSAAQRFVSLATAALLSGKTFFAELISSTASNPSGCGTANCRSATDFSLVN